MTRTLADAVRNAIGCSSRIELTTSVEKSYSNCSNPLSAVANSGLSRYLKMPSRIVPSLIVFARCCSSSLHSTYWLAPRSIDAFATCVASSTLDTILVSIRGLPEGTGGLNEPSSVVCSSPAVTDAAMCSDVKSGPNVAGGALGDSSPPPPHSSTRTRVKKSATT